MSQETYLREVIIVVVIILVIAFFAFKDSAISSTKTDWNCSHFESWQKAQKFFEANEPESDPYKLDKDGDGESCEMLK